MIKEYYRQVEIKKKFESGYKMEVCWVPEKFAKVGNIIKIKINDNWDFDWQITQVFSRKEFDELEITERDFLKQRKASDI